MLGAMGIESKMKLQAKHKGVSKNRGIPKWMVKIMENPIKLDDLGIPLFLETPICLLYIYTYQELLYIHIIHFNKVFHYKSSILGAHPYFWKHP